MNCHFCLSALVALLVSACQSTHVASIDTKHSRQSMAADERRLWKEAEYAEHRAEEVGLVYSNAAVEAYLQSVAAQLVGDRLENPQTELRVHILSLPSRNAITFPNGVLWITTGMLACLDNEAELAAVLGHEAAHFLRRHSLKEERSAATSGCS